MKIIKGNIWDFNPVCITTNGICDKNNHLVMGKGIALDAKLKYKWLPKELGRLVKLYGNQPYLLYKELPYTEHDQTIQTHLIISFPTKHDWRDKSDIDLIIKSAKKIIEIKDLYEWQTIYSVWPGISNGGLNKEFVRENLEVVWTTDEFVIVEQ